MGYLSPVESAIKLGYSVELIEYLTKNCPKAGESRVIKTVKSDRGLLIDEQDLLDYHVYLNNSWPLPEKKTRPHIPQAIVDDVKRESHFACAICGHMDNGEVAHIRSVAKTLNNSPDNLIYLCPNHHSKYDLGYKPASNIRLEEIEAAKKIKRMSRVRTLRYEANAVKTLRAVMEFCAKIERDLKGEMSNVTRNINVTELQVLLNSLPELTVLAKKHAEKDHDISGIDAKLAEIAPKLSAASRAGGPLVTEATVRESARKAISLAKTVIIDIDEVACPHCGGHGQRGWAGSLCAYCGGSCFVSGKKSDAYNPEELDEQDCPRCGGQGQIGLVGDLCRYCGGDGYVTEQKYDEYDEADMDRVKCPHCEGKGMYGWNNTLCGYCGGSCFVSEKMKADYNRDEIDEVDCPRCQGTGQTGLVSDVCVYCKGDCVVSHEKADSYDEAKLDEVPCPHCKGSGQYGWNNTLCIYCGGSCHISKTKNEEYDKDDIDEVECPRCAGSGTTGFVGDPCGLCKGDTVVSRTIRDAYVEKYGRQK